MARGRKSGKKTVAAGTELLPHASREEELAAPEDSTGGNKPPKLSRKEQKMLTKAAREEDEQVEKITGKEKRKIYGAMKNKKAGTHFFEYANVKNRRHRPRYDPKKQAEDSDATEN